VKLRSLVSKKPLSSCSILLAADKLGSLLEPGVAGSLFLRDVGGHVTSQNALLKVIAVRGAAAACLFWYIILEPYGS
jgi:hypothetical protein